MIKLKNVNSDSTLYLIAPRDKFALHLARTRHVTRQAKCRQLPRPGGTCGRWPPLLSRGRSWPRDGGLRSTRSRHGPPGPGCGCWRRGQPRRTRTCWCWRSRGGRWGASCCPLPRAGRTLWCAPRGAPTASRWLARCICRQEENGGGEQLLSCFVVDMLSLVDSGMSTYFVDHPAFAELCGECHTCTRAYWRFPISNL